MRFYVLFPAHAASCAYIPFCAANEPQPVREEGVPILQVLQGGAEEHTRWEMQDAGDNHEERGTRSRWPITRWKPDYLKTFSENIANPFWQNQNTQKHKVRSMVRSNNEPWLDTWIHRYMDVSHEDVAFSHEWMGEWPNTGLLHHHLRLLPSILEQWCKATRLRNVSQPI